MDINTFKKKCKSKKDEHEKRMAEFEIIKTSQQQYEKSCYKPKTTMNWRLQFVEKCPVCDKPLNKEIVDIREFPGWAMFGKGYDIIYACDCGYEYAVTE